MRRRKRFLFSLLCFASISLDGGSSCVSLTVARFGYHTRDERLGKELFSVTHSLTRSQDQSLTHFASQSVSLAAHADIDRHVKNTHVKELTAAFNTTEDDEDADEEDEEAVPGVLMTKELCLCNASILSTKREIMTLLQTTIKGPQASAYSPLLLETKT